MNDSYCRIWTILTGLKDIPSVVPKKKNQTELERSRLQSIENLKIESLKILKTLKTETIQVHSFVIHMTHTVTILYYCGNTST